MKVILKDILQGNESLAKLASAKLNSTLKLRLGRVIKQVKGEMENIEEVRQDLLRQHAQYDPSTDAYKFSTPEKKKEFEKAWRELIGEEADIRFDRFAVDDFAELGEVTANDLVNLEWLFGTIEEEAARPEDVAAAAAG